MPYSTPFLKEEIKQHFIKNVLNHISILDAGAGCGTYSMLLREHFPNMDAVDIFPNYLQMFDLKAKYNNVFIGDIRKFDIDDYEYIILGDIIEHLTFEDAHKLLSKIQQKDKLCLVGVPYEYEQGTYMDNVHETHLQPELTEKIFLERYPFMKLLMGNDKYGYFVNYDFI